MTNEDATKAFLRLMSSRIDSAQGRFAQWTIISDSPLEMMDDCDDQFLFAVWITLGRNIRDSVYSGSETLRSAHRMVSAEVLHRARNGSISTSTTANLLRRAKLQVFAEIQELLHGAIENIV